MAPLRTLLLSAAVAVPLLLAPPAQATQHATVSIANARNQPLGSVVTVSGTVTTPSGAFESSFFDKGFGLQDRTAGIYVSLPTNPNAAPGNRAKVTGTLRDSFGLLILVPTDNNDVTITHRGVPVLPKWVRTAAVGESTESRLVTAQGKITQAPTSDLPYGYKFWINDGSGEVQIFVNVETGIDLASLHLGQRVVVTGLSGQFDTAYEILPRFPRDILALP